MCRSNKNKVEREGDESKQGQQNWIFKEKCKDGVEIRECSLRKDRSTWNGGITCLSETERD